MNSPFLPNPLTLPRRTRAKAGGGRHRLRRAGGLLSGLALLGWAGLQVQPRPFPAYPRGAGASEDLPLPAGLPAPVDRFYRQTYGERLPRVTSAVITGRASLRFIPGGPAFPARFRFVHEAGRQYRHYIEVTWFGLPVLRVNEAYLEGVSRQEMPWPIPSSVGDPRGAQGANLGMWSETVWMPSVYLTDPRVRWTAVDEDTALLSVPFGEDRETYVVRFDPATGRPALFESMRYHGADSRDKTLWINQNLSWADFGGVTLPREGAAIWLDQGRPWAVFTAEEVVYNVDVREYVRQRGV